MSVTNHCCTFREISRRYWSYCGTIMARSILKSISNDLVAFSSGNRTELNEKLVR